MDMPIVFISSTKEDLELYRQAACDASMKADFHPIMMEYFAAGGNPPLKTCLEKVAPCNVLVVIVAHRYGWIPKGQTGRKKKSITWLECEQALKDAKEVLAFLVDEKYSWPEEQKENYRLTKAMQSGTATSELFEEVNTAIQKLGELKSWLKENCTIVHFTAPHSLGAAVLHALTDWSKRHGKSPSVPKATLGIKIALEIPQEYREWLSNRCATVELLAHLTKQGCSPPRLSSVYVPVPTIPLGKEKKQIGDAASGGKRNNYLYRHEEKLHLLLDRFGKESLFVSGLAGSGKSTFSRWVAFLLGTGIMPEQIQLDIKEPIVEQFPHSLKDKLPLLIPLREFWPFLPHYSGQREMSRKEFESALENWIAKKLETIDWPTVERLLTDGRTVLLLDGVDEIPISYGEAKQMYYPREMMIIGLKSALPGWIKKGNHVLLTSRPYGLTESDAREMGMPRSEIMDLPTQLQHLFIRRWFTALAYEPELASMMIDHLSDREELSPLYGHPVLLMAMCILFPEGKRLPQDKAELYQKTIDRLLFNRYGDSIEVDKVHHRLSVIAHGMHTGEGLEQERRTPQAEISYDEIDRILSYYLEQQAYTEKGFTTVAEAREELLHRSGLLIPKAPQSATFYHLSFQDYLAAHRLVELAGDQLYQVIDDYADIPEWRQTLSFAFGSALQNARSPEKGIALLKQMIHEASLETLTHLVLTADLVEIIYRKGYGLEKNLENQFQGLCLDAIEREVSLPERYDLGRTLGLVGDPRIATDLRQPQAGYVEIPAGIYLIGEEKQRAKIKQSFLLLKYPVTNSQYRLFMEEGGYQEDKWWSVEGRKWRNTQNITEPLYLRHSRWNGANLPVVGVSYYEAEAFCRWAGGRLPAEVEWEAAARGPKGYVYPWGDKWQDGICNSYEANLGKTSPVGLFPRSRSRNSALEDMAGNVWEWCADWYDEEQHFRVVRGGSFSDGRHALRCALRNRGLPLGRDDSLGFRMVRGV